MSTSFTPPSEASVGATASAAGASPTEVDTAALLARLQALETKVSASESATHVPALVGAAESLAALIKKHLTGATHPAVKDSDTTQLATLADDVTDAAGNAVTSGDPTAVRNVTAKIATALQTLNPGPGEHPYYSQAVDFATHHVPLAADKLTAPQPTGAPAVSGGAPAKVIAGSVTG